MKTEVYSWRVTTELKTGLEREARRRGTSLSAVLDLAARDWLSKSSAEEMGQEEQLRLHKAASECFGSFAGKDTHRAENSRQLIRQRLQRKHER